MTGTFQARFEDLFENQYPRVPWNVAKAAARSVGYRDVASVADPAARFGRLLIVSDSERFPDADGQPLDITAELAALVPTAPVVRRIATVDFGSAPVIGVFVRAYEDAHVKTVRTSPPEWFYERMDAIRRDHPDVEFFLSTDSPAVSDEIHRRFDGVHELRDKGPHNSAVALVSSIADLYLLASTSYVLGSYHSSFTDTVRWLSKHGAVETTRSCPSRPLGAWLENIPGQPGVEPKRMS